MTMVRSIKLRNGGGSVIFTIPSDIAEKHHMSIGGTVSVMSTDNGVLITNYDQDFIDSMEAYEYGAEKYKNALKALASK